MLMKSWEFPKGTRYPGVVNPVDVPVKMIWDCKEHKFFVYSAAGADGVPRFKRISGNKHWFQESLAMMMAARICVKCDDGKFLCLKTRLTNSRETTEEVLDVKLSEVHLAMECGEKPVVLSEDDVLSPGQRTSDSLQRWMNLRATC